MNIDEFAFALALEDVSQEKFGTEVGDAEFLADLTKEGFFGCLAIGDMSSHGGVPLAWLYILPQGASLEVQFASGIEDMEVYYGMEEHRTAVALTTCGGAYDSAFFIDEGEYFLLVVHAYIGNVSGCKSKKKMWYEEKFFEKILRE